MEQSARTRVQPGQGTPDSRYQLPAAHFQPCPSCGHDIPALKGGRLSICPVCGYKESCCY